jgi:hypothetical protein
MLEKHQAEMVEKVKKEKREAKRKRDALESGQQQGNQPEWAGKSAWRPFDREKDLQIQKADFSAPSTTTSLSARFKPASS